MQSFEHHHYLQYSSLKLLLVHAQVQCASAFHRFIEKFFVDFITDFRDRFINFRKCNDVRKENANNAIIVFVNPPHNERIEIGLWITRVGFQAGAR